MKSLSGRRCCDKLSGTMLDCKDAMMLGSVDG